MVSSTRDSEDHQISLKGQCNGCEPVLLSASGSEWLTKTDRQTDRPTYRPTDRLTDRQTYLPTDLQTDLPTDWQTDRPTDRPTDRQTDQVLKNHVNIWNIAGICALLLRNGTSTASIPRCTVSRTNASMLVDAGVNRISVGICSSPFLEFPTDSRLTRWAAHTYARTHTHARTHTRTHTHVHARTHTHTRARARARKRESRDPFLYLFVAAIFPSVDCHTLFLPATSRVLLQDLSKVSWKQHFLLSLYSYFGRS